MSFCSLQLFVVVCVRRYCCDCINLPSMPPGNLIGSPSSRRNVIVGGGEPVAEHLNVTLLPSFTTMSLLLEEIEFSIIFYSLEIHWILGYFDYWFVMRFGRICVVQLCAKHGRKFILVTWNHRKCQVALQAERKKKQMIKQHVSMLIIIMLCIFFVWFSNVLKEIYWYIETFHAIYAATFGSFCTTI